MIKQIKSFSESHEAILSEFLILKELGEFGPMTSAKYDY